MGGVLLTTLNYRRAGKNKAPQLQGFEGGANRTNVEPLGCLFTAQYTAS